MKIRLKILTLFFLHAVAGQESCAGNVCEFRQLGTPQFVTRLLQCDEPDCQNAVFAPSPSPVCLIRSGSRVRIFLRSCSEFSSNPGFFISNTASVVASIEGSIPPNTAFTDTSCEVVCGVIEKTYYTASNGRTLIADDTQISTIPQGGCAQGLYLYPNISSIEGCNIRAGSPGPSGPSGPSGPPGQKGDTGAPPKRGCPSQTRKRVQLTITDGVSVFTVGRPEQLSGGSYRLPIVEERNGEVLYAQKYASDAIGANGTIERVTAYTLQLARSRKYLVADVLDDTTLNYSGYYPTGLNLKDASEFRGGYAPEPDYRFFVQYNVTIYSVTASVFCPLFHRRYCLYPGVSGYLRLAPVKSTDRSLEPTFVNPTDNDLRHFILYSRPTDSEGLWQVNLSFL